MLCICCSSVSYSQLCVGSLGDPVVNINFGSGTNYGQPLGSTITNYSYNPNGCPNDGFYVIANSIISCFGGSWHAMPEDHTPGDTEGYMMVVNASFNPGDFYVQQVDALCAGATYQVASWIANIQRPGACGGNSIKPRITFQIETLSGNILLKSSTGDIASDNSIVWRQYGAFFTMPAGTSSVVIRLINDARGGCGNDLALDDITFRPCGELITTTINGSNSAYDYCSGQVPVTILSGNKLTGTDVSYQWQSSNDKGATWSDISGATDTNYTAPQHSVPGTYLYRLSAAQASNISSVRCRLASNILTINVHPNPVPVVSSNGPVCEGNDLLLSATDGFQYFWTGPLNYSGNTGNTTVKSADTANSGRYYITVISDKGCMTRDSITALVLQKPVISVSNPSGFCQGASVTLNATGTNVTSWTWSPTKWLAANNVANPKATPDSTITYVVTAANTTCSVRDSVKVTVFNRPIANAGPDKIAFIGSDVLLDGKAGGTDVSILWSPSTYLDRTSIPTPRSASPVDITYTLTVTSARGCGESSDNVVVKVYNKIIPNAFSPNNDGINDTWDIKFLETYPDAMVHVFNRYGQSVYLRSGYYKPWDGTYKGKPIPDGTYYYTVFSSDANVRYSGWVLVVR